MRTDKKFLGGDKIITTGFPLSPLKSNHPKTTLMSSHAAQERMKNTRAIRRSTNNEDGPGTIPLSEPVEMIISTGVRGPTNFAATRALTFC